MKTIHTVLGRQYHHNKPATVSFTITWRSFNTHPLTYAVMNMSKLNYKVHADIRKPLMSVIRACAVFNTGAGPNFVFRGHLPSSEGHIKSGYKTVSSDANGRELNIVGTKNLLVRFLSYVVKFDFYVCEKLATSYVLGGGFRDKFFNSIRPRKRIVELCDGARIPFVMK